MSETTEPIRRFLPPSGGDITLRSFGDVSFQVHSVLLSLVSPVFNEILDLESDEVDMYEDADTLSHFLQSLHPMQEPRPLRSSVEFDRCLQFARKYEIE